MIGTTYLVHNPASYRSILEGKSKYLIIIPRICSGFLEVLGFLSNNSANTNKNRADRKDTGKRFKNSHIYLGYLSVFRISKVKCILPIIYRST